VSGAVEVSCYCRAVWVTEIIEPTDLTRAPMPTAVTPCPACGKTDRLLRVSKRPKDKPNAST
jgi:hypothetical protein